MKTLERLWMCAVWGSLSLACANDAPQLSEERAAMPAFVSAGSAAELPERSEPASRGAAPAAAPAPTMGAAGTAGSPAISGGSSVSAGDAGPTASAASAGGNAAAGSPAAAAGSGATTSAAGSSAPAPATPAEPPLFPEPSTPETRIPSPDNPPECPAVAPENPIGDCIGLPVYVECVYGTYYCICDWVHWLCAG